MEMITSYKLQYNAQQESRIYCTYCCTLLRIKSVFCKP